MRLLFEIDTKEYDPNGKAFARPYTRSIIIRGGTIAMVHSRKYDFYEFPSGGIEAGETKEASLIRETLEETGLIAISETIREYGYVHRIQKSSHPNEDIFIQDNFYYFCDAEADVASLRLEDCEAEEDFHLCWIEPEQAIRTNRFAFHGFRSLNMLERESKVLELLIEEGYFAGKGLEC